MIDESHEGYFPSINPSVLRIILPSHHFRLRGGPHIKMIPHHLLSVEASMLWYIINAYRHDPPRKL